MSSIQPDPQARWDALIDREALGESLDADEREFVERYQAEHPELGLERALFDRAIASLREQVEAPDHDQLAEARVAAAALERYRTERASETIAPVRSARSPWGQRGWWVVGLAAAAGLSLWIGLRETADNPDELGDKLGGGAPTDDGAPTPGEPHRPQPVDSRPTPGAPVDPIGRLSMVASADPHFELGRAVEPGARLATAAEPTTELERACVSWSDPTAVVCFEGELQSIASSEPGERRVRLESGRLVAALAPLGAGQRFTVETVVGTVSAIGTVFAVEMYEGRVWVTVLEGRVELRDPTVRALTAGHRTSLRGEVSGDEPQPLAADTIPPALTHLVDVAELLRASPGQAQLIVPALGDQPVELDGRPLDGPARLELAAREHTLTIGARAAGAGSPREQSLTLGDEPLELAEHLPKPSHEQTARKPAARKPLSAKQLAEAAQREREAKHYEQTAAIYRELLARYPDSPEAVNVPVRLGDLLAATGDHRGALEAYELYLERGAKQLQPEAEFGRIRALRALRRTADELEAIKAFLAARPDDYRSVELEARLAELL